MDYNDVGLKAGLEIHQQLDTPTKLFCSCNSSLSDKEGAGSISRFLRAVSGELGDVDVAAAYESGKKKFNYTAFRDESCLVEQDDEPPHQADPQTVITALQIALMLNCEIVDEIHVMRKTVIDGSNTSGFQRTAMIGINGWIDTSFGKVGITNVSLEEDSCQIIGKEESSTNYGLDRLGIPLIEIGTAPDIRTPEQAKEVAKKLGLMLRSTGNVKRGLGTIRQDVNVSIKGGSRVELKGFQDLDSIPVVIESEIQRQQKLLEIKSILASRKTSFGKPVDLTTIFSKTESNMIKNSLSSGGVVCGVKASGFAGFLGMELLPNRRLGTEVSEFVKSVTGAGIVHSDELPKFGISQDEVNIVKKFLGCEKNDAFILTVYKKDLASKAIDSAIARLQKAAELIPKEVRRVNPDNTTTFLRPMPGEARMYPETDLPPLEVPETLLNYMKTALPEGWEEKIKRFSNDYKLNEDIARQLVDSRPELFEQIVGLGFNPSLVSRALTSTIKDIEREVADSKLTDELIYEIFKKSGKSVSKEALYDAFKKTAETGEVKSVEGGLSDDELRKIVKYVISKNKDTLQKYNPASILMGLVMKEVRGKADGKKAAQILNEEIGK